MNDIALIWDEVNGRADFAIANGDLVMDRGLRTAVILSLFCDRQADPSDTIPDGGTDRRGWWGDTPANLDPAGLDLTGSKLWLLPRLQVPATLVQAEAFAAQALRWMIDLEIADQVVPTATFPSLGRFQLNIAIVQGATATPYDFAWSVS